MADAQDPQVIVDWLWPLLPGIELIGQGGQGSVFLLPAGDKVLKISELKNWYQIRQARLEEELGTLFGVAQGIVTSSMSCCTWASPSDLLGKSVGEVLGDVDSPRLMLIQEMDFIDGVDHYDRCLMVRCSIESFRVG